jgi:peptidoglycan hydrolase-like protein with peptidoglycan-binding domain
MIGAAMTNLPAISEGTSGQTVEWAQYLLVCLTDFMTYRQIDGIFGPQTKTAMEQFQRSGNLTADGVVGPATWAALGGSSPQPPTLTQGARGPVVEKLQYTLNTGRGGFVPASEPVLALDGEYGPMTAAVVRGAQQHAGIPVDGQVGLQTWALPLGDIGFYLAYLCGFPGIDGP